MKNILTLFTLLVLLTTSGCKKDETKPPMEPMDITMPAVELQMPTLPIEWSGWFQFKAVPLNLDSTIRNRTANKYTKEDIRSFTVKSVGFELLNADNLSNLANFERVDVLLTIRNAADLQMQGTTNFADVFASSAALQPNSTNLKQAIDSIRFNSFMYIVAGKVRRGTFYPLNARINIVYHIE